VLQVEVSEIERLTVRVSHHRAAQTQPATLAGEPPATRGDALASIDGHLNVLADAHTELQAIERANGLDDPEQVLRTIAAQPAPPPVPRASDPRRSSPSAPPARRAAH